MYTHRKHYMLLLACLLATLISNVVSMPMPISCPEPCECYLNNNGLQLARCSEIYLNQTDFPNIHVLVMHISEDQSECNIPKDIHLILPQLNFINMMNCSLTHIPVDTFKGLESLQEIDLSNNFMKKFDPSLFINNPKLAYADLHNNPLPIHDRPILISKSLRELDLSNCGIKEIPENMFKNLIRLQRLHINNNKITTIKEGTLPSGLQYLYINNNKLTSIENGTLPNALKVLILNNNLLSRIPEVEFARLKKIRRVDLSQNPINCTCDEMTFVNVFAEDRPMTFENGVQCFYPRQYRGQSINNIPEQFCLDQIGEGVDDDDDDDYSDPQTNQVIPEEKHAKKKDDVQKYFEVDQVVPVDKKTSTDYNKDEMQSDSISNEGSGDGGDYEDRTDMPFSSKNDDKTKHTNNSTSNNNENNETKPNDEETSSKLSNTNGKDENAKTKDGVSATTSDLFETKKPKENEPNTEPTEAALEVTNPETTPENSKPKFTDSKPNTESTEAVPGVTNLETTLETSKLKSTDSELIKSDPELTISGQPNIQEPPKVKDDSSVQLGVQLTTSENTSSSNVDGITEITKLPDESKTSADSSTSYHAQLQNESNSDSPIFNLGYIIPCLAIIIVIIICLGVYLGQRSSHKNWEPNNTNTNNDGAELQDVSLLPDKSKVPIVRNKKYISEENSEQTERLMNDGDPSIPKSVWEHLEEPIENGNSKYVTDTLLPNGQSIDKNEPIECAIAKVTTLPDSIPRTPLIRNT